VNRVSDAANKVSDAANKVSDSANRVSDSMQQLPYGGAGDAQAGERSLADRFRRHAGSLVRSGRSPLYVQLMVGAAEDIDRRGQVAGLFDGVPVPPGSVPQLRLMASLHHLVLAGRAPALASFYPSAGGDRPVDGVWPAAAGTITEHFGEIKGRLRRAVQTNEPGRSAVLFAGLLWLSHRYRRPIRLLEIGASAGLNLLVDRYAYVVGGRAFGDPASPVRFVEPWRPAPPIDLAEAAASLRIAARSGCDLAPLDPRRTEDRLTLLSYIWPDELHRIERMRAALEIAARDPIPIAARPASEWLPEALAAGENGELTVVWHSVMRQYVGPEEWEAIERTLCATAQGDGGRAPVRLSMEPAQNRAARMELTVHDPAGERPTRLAVCDDHGLPIQWEAGR
jgi:hypothetical protein